MRELNGAESLMGFLGWLACREDPVTFSRYHDASIVVQLFEEWNRYQEIGVLAEDWSDCLATMPDAKIGNTAQESFKTQLTRLINHHGLEGGSDTPDFILADFLVQCLATFGVTIAHRESWYGRPLYTKSAVITLDTESEPFHE